MSLINDSACRFYEMKLINARVGDDISYQLLLFVKREVSTSDYSLINVIYNNNTTIIRSNL